MMPLLGVTTSSLIIEVSMALIALAIGFFGGLWYVRFTAVDKQKADEGTSKGNGDKSEQDAFEAERVSMAAQQLQDLAKNMAFDVGEHKDIMTGITSDLGGLDLKNAGSGTAVVDAVSKIFEANSKLQGRLADAEQKIQNQAEEIRAERSEARTDALTKLANRRAFDDAVAKNIKAFGSEKRSFSLMIFDVDHFKKFNDTHGHQAGDEVLRRVGQTMTQVVKATDIPCRYGGEEFALIMPNTKIDKACLAAERVREAIEAMKVNFEGKTLSVTASMGVAEIAPGDVDAKLIRRADDAVYFSKEAGRNCGHWHDGTQCLPVKDPVVPKAAPAATEEKAAPNAPLVGLDDLPDHAVFTGELDRRISESHRFGVSLSAMYVRVVDYSELEKEYGNAVGKLLLDSVVQFIRNTLRDMDLLAKLEPGEFIVMLPGSSAREATLVGSRVQSAIANCVIPLGKQELRLEIQQGVADVAPDDEAQSMMAHAKEVMLKNSEKVPVA